MKLISVKERLPERFKNIDEHVVLVLTTSPRYTYPHMFVSTYSHETESWCDISGNIVTTNSQVLRDCKLKVTHWTPLPELPEDWRK